MKTLYFDCQMGAAGDMLTAALLDLFEQPDEVIEALNRLGIPGVEFTHRRASKCGVEGEHVSVTVNGVEEVCEDVLVHEQEHAHDEGGFCHGHHHHHGPEDAHGHDEGGFCHGHHHDHGHEHHHSSLADVRSVIEALPVDQGVKDDAIAVYGRIAEAESHAHGVPVTEVHFHEVGAMDAVADVMAVCYLIHELKPDQILCSPIHVGCGHVHCAHGILPVPAPATAYILRGIPMYGGEVRGELCTPTGAALLRHFAEKFCSMPGMSVARVGYGMGRKAFERANCVRAFMGTALESADVVSELSCNLDDMTPEAIGFAQERLLDAGALDVFTSSIMMKKSRPGVMLTALCRMQDRDVVVKALFEHTTTIGIREKICQRYVMAREMMTVSMPEGDVRIKKSSGFGVERVKPEYDDIARIARTRGVSFKDVEDEVMRKL